MLVRVDFGYETIIGELSQNHMYGHYTVREGTRTLSFERVEWNTTMNAGCRVERLL